MTPRAEERAEADVLVRVLEAESAAAADATMMVAATLMLAEVTKSEISAAATPVNCDARAVLNALWSKEETSPARVKLAWTTGLYSPPGRRGGGDGGGGEGGGGDGGGGAGTGGWDGGDRSSQGQKRLL